MYRRAICDHVGRPHGPALIQTGGDRLHPNLCPPLHHQPSPRLAPSPPRLAHMISRRRVAFRSLAEASGPVRSLLLYSAWSHSCTQSRVVFAVPLVTCEAVPV